VRGVGFTVDGRRVLSGNVRHGLILADVPSGRELYRLGSPLLFACLAVAPNGRWVVTGNADTFAHVWTLDEDVLAARQLAHQEELSKAEQAYAQLLQRHPDDVELRGERARFFARQQKWDPAIADYTEALQKRNDDADLWAERGECYHGANQPDKASRDYDKALTLLASDPNAAALRTALFDELIPQEDLFNRVVKLRPKDTQPWLARVHYFANRGQWKQAAASLVKLTELDPEDHENWYMLAPVYLELGDKENYRRVCLEMLKRFSAAEKPEIIERTAKTCLLVADAGIDRKLALQLAERAATRGADQANAKWFHMAKGIADYREGQYAKAVERLEKSLTPGTEVMFRDSMAYLFLAMAHYRLGESDEAAQSLYKARFLMDDRFPKLERGELLGPEWADWLRFMIVRREVEALVKVTAFGTSK
jgi:tetratricopeptide (TPR) repeat protein